MLKFYTMYPFIGTCLLVVLGANAVIAQPEMQHFYTAGQCRAVQTQYKKAGVRHVETLIQSGVDTTALIERSTELYNENGQMTAMILTQDGIAHDTVAYSYGADGALLTQIPTDAQSYSVGYMYDAEQRLSEQLVSSAEAREYRFMYDQQGRLSLKIGKAAFPITNDSTDEVTVIWRDVDFYHFYYDKKGLLIQKEVEEMGSTPYTALYEYDAKQQIRTENIKIRTEGGKLIDSKHRTYTYAPNGMLTRIDHKDLLGDESYIMRRVYTR